MYEIHPFKVYDSIWFLVYSPNCVSIITINFRIFSLALKINPSPLSHHLPTPGPSITPSFK